MPSIIFKGKNYDVETPINDVSVVQLIKYLFTIDPSSQLALTKDLDEAASYHLRLLVPDFPIEIASDKGIRKCGIAEFSHLVQQLTEIQAKEKGGATVVIEMDKQDNFTEIQWLKDRIKKLEEKG